MEEGPEQSPLKEEEEGGGDGVVTGSAREGGTAGDATDRALEQESVYGRAAAAEACDATRSEAAGHGSCGRITKAREVLGAWNNEVCVSECAVWRGVAIWRSRETRARVER